MTAFARLVGTSERVGATRARLPKVRELAALLKSLEPGEIEAAVLYLSGEIPQGRIGIGHATLPAAAAGAADTSVPVADSQPTTDSQSTADSLSIAQADQKLAALAAISGSGSNARRAEGLRELFGRCSLTERQFLFRLLTGELRQGALAGVMTDAIAAAAGLPVARVRRAAMYSSNLGTVARVAILEGDAALDRFQLELFSPVAPMLAQTAADVGEALETMGEAAFEWKMDGARIQVHKLNDEVRIYTRGLNEVTAAVPEIVETVRSFPGATLVLDGEAISFDGAGRPRPFQMTMRRFGRRLNVEQMRAELPIQAFFFDCLRVGEHSIADRPTVERFQALTSAVPESLLVPRLVTASESAARAFYDAALDAGHEGIMAKSLSAPYEAGNRGADWLKIKRAHTLDLVVLAAEWGHGRRTGKLSNLHLGALDPTTGEYVMLGKTFKGLTDAVLDWQTQELLAREIRRDKWTVYVRPELVVEVAFSDLQASTRYAGGLALRLARVKRYRDDKQVREADDMTAVRRIFVAQGGEANQGAEPK